MQVLCSRTNLSVVEDTTSGPIDWKEVYLILCRQPEEGSKTLWNREDNLTASKIIAQSSSHTLSEDVLQSAREGSINILSEYIDDCDWTTKLLCLFEAARYGHAELVTLLKERDPDEALEQALLAACSAQLGNERGNYTLIVRELLSGTADPELFCAALEYDDNWE